jgi:hypothetical protein
VAFKSLYRIAQPLTSVKHTKPGRLVWGVLKEKMPGGVRVEFDGDISGVFPTSAMSQATRTLVYTRFVIDTVVSCGVTRLDRIRNKVIRNKINVTEVSRKIEEMRVCSGHGHVKRTDESYIGKRVESMEVRGRKGRGRPKKRWKDCVNQDLGEKNLSGHEVLNRAA